MEQVSQYITVYMANITTDPYKTPDCFPDLESFCNRITCRIKATREEFNFTVNPCYSSYDHEVTFDTTYFDGRVSIYKESKSASSILRFMNSANANLIFNNLDNGDNIQLKVGLELIHTHTSSSQGQDGCTTTPLVMVLASHCKISL